MNIVETPLSGVFVVEPIKHEDHRGFFARLYCQETWQKHDLDPTINQCNISYSKQKGTIRGLHFQTGEHAEVKLVRCCTGVIFDVAVDLRKDSPTYGQWYGLELTADNYKQLYIPKGFAHGFQTLTDNAEIFYQVSNPYNPKHEAGLRYNDPQINIKWPLSVTEISEKDANLPLLSSSK